MMPEIIRTIYRYEKVNWWFVGRYALIADFHKRCLQRSPRANIPVRLLDVGCGTGAMLEQLQSQARTFGIDVSSVAMELCRQRGQRQLTYADGTCLPYRDATFDTAISLDVVEHIEDDLAVMREICRVLQPGGFALITIPACEWLRTTRDERLMHKRRYHRAQFVALARQAGFEVEKCSYYCASFFPAMAAIVLLNNLLGRKTDIKEDVVQPAPWVNALLRELLFMEQRLMRWVSLPFGVSLFCVLRKPPTLTLTGDA